MTAYTTFLSRRGRRHFAFSDPALSMKRMPQPPHWPVKGSVRSSPVSCVRYRMNHTDLFCFYHLGENRAMNFWFSFVDRVGNAVPPAASSSGTSGTLQIRDANDTGMAMTAIKIDFRQ